MASVFPLVLATALLLASIMRFLVSASTTGFAVGTHTPTVPTVSTQKINEGLGTMRRAESDQSASC